MLLHRQLGRSLRAAVELMACDLSFESVEKSRRAVYTSWSFRGAPTWCLQYFENAGGALRLSHPDIRNGVSFSVQSCQDAARGYAAGALDVVMFRNVAIYMEDWAIAALHEQFARVLGPGGLLALGPSDPLPVGNQFELVDYYDNSPVFVRRPESQALAADRPAARLFAATEASEPVWVRAAPSPPMRQEPARPSGPLGVTDEVDLLERLVGAAPDEPTSLRLLGQAFLERAQPAQAVEALRQAVFLDAKDVLARYFFVLALRESGDMRHAQRQLSNVLSILGELSGEVLLSDSVTTASELLRGARYLEGQWK
jgi:SAM-dependent methyltransferase